MNTLTLFMGLCCLTSIVLVVYSMIQQKHKDKKKKSYYNYF